MNKNLEQAIVYHRQGKKTEAENHYLLALADDFDSMDGLYLLGTLYLQQGKIGLAANLFKQALLIKKDHFECWNNLGNCYKSVNKEADGEACFKTALAIQGRKDNDYADIYNNLCTLHINSGTPESGIEPALKALELDPIHPDANWNLSLLYLEKGNFAKGFELYHWGFKTKNRIYREYEKGEAYWDGTPGKSVVVWGEQGIGDEILFASMIPDLQKTARRVIFECHPRLVNIFKESFPDITIYPTRKDAYIEWPNKDKDFEAKIAIGDLAKFFRKDINDFPAHEGYLKASKERIEHYKTKLSKLGDRPKIGISWTGGYIKTRKDYRTVSLDQWKNILKQPADFISLQYTPDAYNTIAEIEDRFDVRIHHWPSAVQNQDYHETAALVSSLDLIITVNTAIHHIAGALGKPCFTLTPVGKAWRYYSPDGISNPWYPSVRQFENKKHGEWSDVLNQVTHHLKVFIEDKCLILK